MAQFDVVKLIFEMERPVTRKELDRRLDLHPSSVGAGIKDCINKGYIRKTESGYVLTEDIDAAKLEKIRPRTIDELKD